MNSEEASDVDSDELEISEETENDIWRDLQLSKEMHKIERKYSSGETYSAFPNVFAPKVFAFFCCLGPKKRKNFWKLCVFLAFPRKNIWKRTIFSHVTYFYKYRGAYKQHFKK